MQFARSAIAVHPRTFGRGPRKHLHVSEPGYQLISDDLKLFATTFAAGFLFVSVLLA
jgi:hypothetical protein